MTITKTTIAMARAGLFCLARSPPVLHSRYPERGLVQVTTITLLEAGYSVKSTMDMGGLLDRPPLSLMPVEYLTRAAERRAVEVPRSLAERGQHRAPSISNLLIAAAAETARHTVLT